VTTGTSGREVMRAQSEPEVIAAQEWRSERIPCLVRGKCGTIEFRDGARRDRAISYVAWRGPREIP